MTTIRPNKQGIWPRLMPGIYSLALGNGTQFEAAVLFNQDTLAEGHELALGLFGRGCYAFAIRADAGYVACKLGLTHYIGDAANVADFINDQLFEPGSVKRQGRYSPNFCED